MAQHRQPTAVDREDDAVWSFSSSLTAWWHWIFSLGFAAEGARHPRHFAVHLRVRSMGRLLPWLLTPMLLVWSELYQLGFWGMVGMLEVQSLILGLLVAAFSGRSTVRLKLLWEAAVNVFIATLLLFLGLLVLSFLFGFVLLILSEA